MYTTIERGAIGSDTLPNNVLRVNKSTLALAANIAETFQSNRYRTDKGREVVKIGLAADTHAQRIQLVLDPKGFAFAQATNDSTGVLSAQIPSNFRRLGMPTGDYKLVQNSSLEFELVR